MRLRRSVAALVGAYAIAVIAEAEPTRMVVARMGAPLLLGLREGESFAASDASALLQVTQRMIYLEEGDCADVSLAGARIVDAKCNAVERALHLSQLSPQAVELGRYRHYMQKEIFEQPEAIANTLEMVLNAQAVSPRLFGTEAERIFKDVDAALIVACGTSYHAGLVARYWLEGLAGIPCNVEIASEYRYRESVPNPAPSSWAFRSQARPPTRLRRCITPGRSAIATAWRSATLRNRLCCAPPSLDS
jgi:glucosamine--fructose-6-phosphate aminotransferase (isomerizing)